MAVVCSSRNKDGMSSRVATWVTGRLTGQDARCRQIRDTQYRSCMPHMQADSAGSGGAIAMWVISMCFVQVCGVLDVSGEPENGGWKSKLAKLLVCFSTICRLV